MVISRKEYERLCEENAELRAKYEDLRFKIAETNKGLYEENSELRVRYEALKVELAETKKQYIDIWTQHCRNFLDDYEYAVLLPKNGYTLKVWNDGKFEEKVREIEVGQEQGCIPHFRIEK